MRDDASRRWWPGLEPQFNDGVYTRRRVHRSAASSRVEASFRIACDSAEQLLAALAFAVGDGYDAPPATAS